MLFSLVVAGLVACRIAVYFYCIHVEYAGLLETVVTSELRCFAVRRSVA